MTGRKRRLSAVVAILGGVAIGWSTWYATRRAEARWEPEEVPATQFPFEVVGVFQPPPDGGFWMPMDLTVSESRVWIVDYKAGRLYEYTRDGEFVGSIGGAGQGPGEFRAAAALGVLGDTVWVLNTGNGRIDYFDRQGRYLGTQPLPDEVQGASHMVALGGDFIATILFNPAPLLRFKRGIDLHPNDADVRPFGHEIAERAAMLQGSSLNVPQSYRLHLVGSHLWVIHAYLPVIGVYDTHGMPIQIITYPAPPIGSGQVEVVRDAGTIRRVVTGPDPVGSSGVLWSPDGRAYLLTQQEETSESQRIYELDRDGTVVGRTVSPIGGPLVFATSQGEGGYAIGARSLGGEPEIYILRWRGHP